MLLYLENVISIIKYVNKNMHFLKKFFCDIFYKLENV